MGQILTKTVFHLKVSDIQLNYAFLLFWSIFFWNSLKTSLFIKKVTFSERSTEIWSKFVFLNKFERGKSWGKFGFIWTTVFDQTIKRGQILTKNIFLLKVRHIQLNYAFPLFWSIFGEIHWKILFLSKKWLSQKGALKYAASLFFLTSLKRVKFWGKFGFG